MPDFIQVSTTVASRIAARRLCRELVRRRLVACAQLLGPVESHYRWQGRQELSREWLCLLKCRRRDFRRLEQAIRSLHEYQTPELIALPVGTGSRDYLAWLTAETGPGK